MAKQKNRKAHFLTVVALNIDGKTHLFEGKINGTIIDRRKGDSGFGYDPIFYQMDIKQPLGEMDIDLKNKISHRFLAFQKLIEYLGMRTK